MNPVHVPASTPNSEPSPAANPEARPARIAVVEDDAGFRSRLEQQLNSVPGWSCVAACPTADSALELLPGLRPDLVLIDVRLRDLPGKPDQSGLDLVPRLKRQLPEAKLVMWTIVDDTDEILQAIQHGAWSYILKGGSKDELCAQIRVILDGGAFMSAAVARRLLEWFQAHTTEKHQGFRLTEREWQVLGLRARGKSRTQIAAALGTSPNTVRNQFSTIYSKFGIRDAAAIIYQVGPALRVRETLRSLEGQGPAGKHPG
jgi:DNA-binding NarL/FixJ family response regulator